MKDTISVQRIKELAPYVQEDFSNFLTECENAHNVTLRIMEPVTRTISVQNELYSHGRNGDKRDIVTDAIGGKSYHNYGLAIDVCHLNDDGKTIDWKFDNGLLQPIMLKYGIEWGGNWHVKKDRPHFQKTFGYTVEQLFDLSNGKGGFVNLQIS